MSEEPEVIYQYTNDQAIADGLKIALGPRLYATTNLAVTLAPPTDPKSTFDARVLGEKLGRVVKLYNDGIYADPPEADQHKEADAYMALYDVDGVRVWAILDADGLHLILPEDY